VRVNQGSRTDELLFQCRVPKGYVTTTRLPSKDQNEEGRYCEYNIAFKKAQ
jgi:hypothetical protein